MYVCITRVDAIELINKVDRDTCICKEGKRHRDAAGDESQLVVLVRAYTVVRLACAGMWRIPVTRRVRTANLETFEAAAAVLNDQVRCSSQLMRIMFWCFFLFVVFCDPEAFTLLCGLFLVCLHCLVPASFV